MTPLGAHGLPQFQRIVLGTIVAPGVLLQRPNHRAFGIEQRGRTAGVIGEYVADLDVVRLLNEFRQRWMLLRRLRGLDLSNQKRLMVCRFSAVARQTRLDARIQIFEAL